ncbi:MAG: IABC-2 type transport system permease protein [Candidatus Ordinivivax streblomastigis]|uniref:IABC-2 type transport system permease protein n=1 Tax=Candidatus Ordinivivax streblomastigis TaxID=2540710 RepID=A0A5M8NXN0_9BACT|nr:MAG: IABC-2 type transport system permease protein [Candidatus Ordinivivax streblomastigis]
MLRYLIEKEFKQIVRNPFLPKLILAMPLVMMLVLPWAANQEIKNIRLSVVDNDKSVSSERLIHKINASDYFLPTDISSSNEEALHRVEAGDADIILEVPYGFEKNLMREEISRLMISSNATNGAKGGLGASYLSAVIGSFSEEIRMEKGVTVQVGAATGFNIIPNYRFNPHLDYKTFMIPAIMVMLLTLLTGFLPALNIVGEKEVGTIEQINISPVKKFWFIFGKLIPYWVMGFIVLNLCFGLAALVYGLVPAGSLLTIYLFALIYILVVSGLGLVISNYSNTMQQAMFVMFFFVMVLILISGLFTPINSMPGWAKAITWFNPLRYFMEVMRAVYLKGSSFSELTTQFFALVVFALVFNGWAVASYRKRE